MNWELVIQFISIGIFGVVVGFWLCWITEVKTREKLFIHYKKRAIQFNEFLEFHRLHSLWLRFTV